MKTKLAVDKKNKKEDSSKKKLNPGSKVLVEHSSYEGIEKLMVRESGTKLCFILTK